METAGKFVEDEELRAAMKENGIGRPSSRAGIIETLFKRHYIRRQRKNLMATPTGIQLIETIREKLLTSCELTGIWEKKLRDIERKNYDAAQFVNELKDQVAQIVSEVLADSSQRHIAITTDEDLKKTSKKKASTKGKTSSKEAAPQKEGDSSKEATSPKVGGSMKKNRFPQKKKPPRKKESPRKKSLPIRLSANPAQCATKAISSRVRRPTVARAGAKVVRIANPLTPSRPSTAGSHRFYDHPQERNHKYSTRTHL